MYYIRKVFLSHIHKHIFLLSWVHLITLISSLFLPFSLCLSPVAVCAVGYVKLYSSSSSREREDTHERTTPHLPGTAVLSRKDTSTERITREWSCQGESEWGREGWRHARRENMSIIIISSVSMQRRDKEENEWSGKRYKMEEMLDLWSPDWFVFLKIKGADQFNNHELYYIRHYLKSGRKCHRWCHLGHALFLSPAKNYTKQSCSRLCLGHRKSPVLTWPDSLDEVIIIHDISMFFQMFLVNPNGKTLSAQCHLKYVMHIGLTSITL